MTARPLVSILTLGCKLNLADSDALSGMLSSAGYRVTDQMCEADAIIINTCSVTRMADQKSRKLIRAARRLSPDATVAVTGCYPANARGLDFEELGVDLIAGMTAEARSGLVTSISDRLSVLDEGTQRTIRTHSNPLRNRAFVEAQTGCNDSCAFCIIPRTRGSERSRPAEDVARSVSDAVVAGAQEVVITGTQLGEWGRDLGGEQKLADLISLVLSSAEVPRIRLSSLQPQSLPPELLAQWEDPRLMPHFHLALQSGSPRVLQQMRRRYTVEEFELTVERIRAAVPSAAITTDVIVGFPGETADDFARTLEFCDRVGFSRIHAFPYSARERTLAFKMPEQVDGETKRARMASILQLGTELTARFEDSFLGDTRTVLWENPSTLSPDSNETAFEGYTDNYIRVRARGVNLAGRITPAYLSARNHNIVEAEVTETDGATGQREREARSAR
jgi:threonylcarbamoyladenosine tRNA methylthiotransferase MtaB